MTINNLNSSLSFVWIFNPFFCIFGENMTDTGDIEFLPYMKKLNDQIYFSLDNQKQKIVRDYIFNHFEYAFEDAIGVLTITYYFALLVSTVFRSEFYDRYYGKVPAFVQFLLNSIRIGPLDNNYSVSFCKQDFMMGAGFYPTYAYPIYPSELKFEDVLDWFHLLDSLFADNSSLVKHFVFLEKIPVGLEANQKLTLTSFNQYNKKFLSNPNLEYSKLKEKYIIVSKAVNANLLRKEDALKASSYWSMKSYLGYNYKEVSENINDSKVIFDLIDFIIYCSEEDLCLSLSDHL